MRLEDSDLLWKLVEVYGLGKVVSTLATLCRDQASDLRWNWQDEAIAQLWDSAAHKLEKLPPFNV